MNSSKTTSVVFALIAGIAVMMASAGVRAQDAKSILAKADQVGLSGSAKMEVTQTVITPSGSSRTFKMVSYSKDGSDKGLTEYVAPSKVAGMKILTLNDGDDIWTYFPSTNRVRKIASSARNRKVQGSDFTYDDMATGKMERNWIGSVIGSAKVGGKDCHKLELKPTKYGPQSYSKILIYIDKKAYTPMRIDYYDEDGEELKRLEMLDYRKVNGIMVPFEYTMTNLTDGGKTTMKVAKCEINLPLDDQLFSESTLGR